MFIEFCRSCGYVFCATCSNYQHEVPKEQLFKNVRVCCSCYMSLTADATGGQDGCIENCDPLSDDCDIANELLAATSVAKSSPSSTQNNTTNMTSPSSEVSAAAAISLAVTSAAAASKTTPAALAVSGGTCRPAAVASAAS